MALISEIQHYQKFPVKWPEENNNSLTMSTAWLGMIVLFKDIDTQLWVVGVSVHWEVLSQ